MNHCKKVMDYFKHKIVPSIVSKSDEHLCNNDEQLASNELTSFTDDVIDALESGNYLRYLM